MEVNNQWNLPQDLRVRLGKTDSIHDFDDNGGRVPTNCWNSVSQNLLANLYGLQYQQSMGFTQWLQQPTIYGNNVSASKVEEQTIIWFENNNPFELRTNNRLKYTYREFLNPSNIIPDNIDILELDIGDLEDWNMNYSNIERKQIGLAILNFFFPPSRDQPVINSQQPTYISFDAHSNMPDKIFGEMDQVVNLVTPLNISDSAGTESHLNGKNYYLFPEPPQQPYIFDSNIYSNGAALLDLQITKPNYERNTRYDFNLNIATQQGASQLRFNPDNRSGPSVTYLSESINNISTRKQIYLDPSKMVDLSPLNSLSNKDLLIKILFDLKRGGDWEQANAAKKANNFTARTNSRTIFASIDRLCALYSRCIQQNTIYHFSTSMILYRFKGAGQTPQQIKSNKISFLNEKIKNLFDLNTKISYLTTRLNQDDIMNGINKSIIF